MIGHHYHLWKCFSTYIWPTRQKGTVLTSIQAGTHPAHNDGRSLFFHLGWNHILLTMMKDSHPGWNTSCSQSWNISALTFIQAGTHPTTVMNDSHPGRNTSYHNDEWLSPRLEHILPQWWNISALTFTQARTHPTTMMKGLYTYIHPCGNTSYHNDEMALYLHSPRREHILPQWCKGLHSYLIL